MDRANEQFYDFLYSLDGRDFLVAAGLSRGMSVEEICRFMHCGTWSVDKARVRVLAQYLVFQEDVEHYGEKEAEGETATTS
jgi:hypothetical protein